MIPNILEPLQEDDKSFYDHIQDQQRSGDAIRSFDKFDSSSIKIMAYKAAKWGKEPQQAILVKQYFNYAKSIDRVPDIEKDAFELWSKAKLNFPDFSKKYPTLLKMAITEGTN